MALVNATTTTVNSVCHDVNIWTVLGVSNCDMEIYVDGMKNTVHTNRHAYLSALQNNGHKNADGVILFEQCIKGRLCKENMNVYVQIHHVHKYIVLNADYHWSV